MTVQATLVTADDLLAMCEEDRYELVKGVLEPMSPLPGPEHGETTMTLGILAGSFVRTHRLGRAFTAETDFRLRRNPDTVRAPDFAFVANGRITSEMDPTRYYDLAPDLVAEVVSPSDSAARINTRVLEYLDAGVRLVLVLYPQSKTVEVHRPGDQLSGEDMLSGFTCPVADLFAEPELA